MDIPQSQKIAQKIETAALFLWGITLLLFPLLFTTYTTDAYVLPKMFLLAGVILFSLIAWGLTMILYGQVRLRRTPLDVPVLLFMLAGILSSVFAVNRYNSLIATTGLLYASLAYFILVNLFRSKKALLFFISCLITGSVFVALVATLAKFHIFLLPFLVSKTVTFSPLGNNMDLALYMAMLLPLALAFVMPIIRKKFTARIGVFAVASLALAICLAVSVWKMNTTQKVVLLPFDIGFQTSFAAISQDSQHVLQSFFFGLGYGNYGSVFSRFHPASFNSNADLWFYAFNTSSSFVLELLATTGLVGILAYFFLLLKAITPIDERRKNPLYFSLVIAGILSVILPFSLIEVALLFILLSLFVMYQREQHPNDYFDIEIKFVALKKGVFAFTTLDDAAAGKKDIHPTPIAAFVILLGIALLLGFYTTAYAVSTVLFQQSIAMSRQNNGTQTYKLQVEAMSAFPFDSSYYRVFSQTNIALANSLLASSKGSSPSATTQQTAFTLIQQGISTAQMATKLAPQSAIEWQNLSSVYRSLIAIGQNAQNFAISAAQQAIILDPSNPQEYITLGGLYYQVGQYDNAIRMFQQAISLKNDYANAYYNIGHAYEQKNDLQNALAQFVIVQNLVQKDKTSYSKITAEIDALKAKIGNMPATQTGTSKPQSTATQQPLTLPGQLNQPTPTK